MANILVIDDEDYIRKIIRRTLEKDGHIITEAENGEEALKLTKQDNYDIAIIDLVMPAKGGLETIMELRCNNPGIEIVIVSGKYVNNSSPLENLTKQFGVKHIFSKPVKTKELQDAVNSIKKQI